MKEELLNLLLQFRLDAAPVRCEPYGCGHINRTYLAVTESGRRYILQQINHHTFRDVAGLMENVTSVTDFLRYMCVLKGIDKKQGEQRIAELLEIVNLSEAGRKKVGALSGGMRQRLGIAQAMLSDPGILILDEPTSGLDPRERIRFRNLISQFSENRIVILATHIVSDIEFIANRIILLHEGKLLMFDTPATLCEELAGKVWALSLEESDVPASLVHHTISNLARESSGIRLRILSETKPHPAAVEAAANLEEVFLYHCGEEAQ